MEENLNQNTEVAPPSIFKRNIYGLIDGVDYKFHDDNTVNWRAMVDFSDLVPNKEYFPDLSEEDFKKLNVAELPDSKLLILLIGIKRLARLRGYNSVSYELLRSNNEYVVCKCTIEFIGNYETDGRSIKFESIANATIENVNSFGLKFLESIAENRAFVRCVRNFLNIPIVGADEISKKRDKKSTSDENEPSKVTETDPVSMVKQKVSDLNWSFDDLKFELLHSNEENIAFNLRLAEGKETGNKKPVLNGVEKWKSYSDIPKEYIFHLISRLSKKIRAVKK